MQRISVFGAQSRRRTGQNAYGTTVYLYQMADENPAAWVTPAIVKATDEEMLATILDPRFDVRRAALLIQHRR
jgi:hypothetical protein